MRPKVSIIAGPNGSGKSTLIRRLQSRPDSTFPVAYINADDIERELAKSSSLSKQELEKIAFQEARDLRGRYRQDLTPHAFETVFSHASNLLDMVLLRKNFDIELFCVSTDNPQLNALRVQNRVLAGGHSIDEQKILARYARSLRFWPLAIELANRATVYDNSDELTPVVLCKKGVWKPLVDVIPEYIVQMVTEPLKQRAEERREIVALGWSATGVIEGEYRGPVVKAGKHYLVQAISDTAVYLHDSILLDREIQPEWAGREISIAYGAAEYGLAQVELFG